MADYFDTSDNYTDNQVDECPVCYGEGSIEGDEVFTCRRCCGTGFVEYDAQGRADHYAEMKSED